MSVYVPLSRVPKVLHVAQRLLPLQKDFDSHSGRFWMQTQLLSISNQLTMSQVLRAFAKQLPIALPTDTVYGLSCPFDSATGIQALYRVKGRDPSKAIPVLLGCREQLVQVAQPFHSDIAAALASRFWPGPLTIVLSAQPHLPSELLAGGTTVAVRLVSHPVFEAISCQTGPLATTSANLSGQPDCSNAQDVYSQLQGRIPLIVNGGPSPESQPSTIVKVVEQDVTVVRSGSLAAAVEDFLGGGYA